MKIALEWLGSLVDLPADDEFAARLTSAGLECEVHAPAPIPGTIVAGRVLTCEKHPDADRLSVCTVDVGDGRTRSIVCGAPNAKAGIVGACALPGTDFGEGFIIAERKLRGVPSEGMLCSERELGLSESHDGILYLSDDVEPGTPLQDALARPRVLEVEPLSNRGDWMSVRGVARETSAVLGVPWEDPVAAEASGDAGPWSVEIEDPGDCARYAGRVLEGIAVGPSPAWIADRLQAAGIRPISNVVDVTNYVLLEHGQPLHAFDLEKLTGYRIGVRRARGGESVVTLDGKRRELTPDVLVITDGSGVVATGGVMGGASTMVTDGTTRVFLEGAAFGAARIRAGARAMRLATDASGRFERGVDPEGTARALDRAVQLLLETSPGASCTHSVDQYPAPVRPTPVTLRRSSLARILGTELPAAEVRRIFEGLELRVDAEDDRGWQVTAPTFRRDLVAEEDLIEEVARIHGYDRFPERTVVHARALSQDSPRVAVQDRTRALWLGFGCTEVVTPGLIDGEAEAALGTDEFFRAPVPVRNPLSQDRGALRGSLVPSLVQVLATNVARADRDLAVFEVGRVWSGDPAAEVEEKLRLGVLLSGTGLESSRTMGAKSCDFFDMKGLLEVYVEEFRGASPSVESASAVLLDPVRCAGIRAENRSLGFLGEPSPELRKAFDLPADLPVVVAELDLDGPASGLRDPEFRSLPKYPGVLRDLAFVVPRRVRHADLAENVVQAAGEWLVEVRLFDVYEGAPLKESEKSLAFTLRFRSPDRSLTNDEVDGRVKAVVDHLSRELGARIR